MGTVCSREDKHESTAVLYNHPLPSAIILVLTEAKVQRKKKSHVQHWMTYRCVGTRKQLTYCVNILQYWFTDLLQLQNTRK